MDDSANEYPVYITEADGTSVITLASSATIDGVQVSEIRMREPTVGDMKRMQAMRGGDAEKEISAIANVCEIMPKDVEALTLRNFGRLQEAFKLFTS